MRATFRDSQLQAQLERDGYAVLDALNESEVEALRVGFDRIGAAPGDPELACHSSFHSFDRDYKLRVHEQVTSVISPMLEREFDRQRALPSNYIVKWPSGMSGFGLHQDLSLVDETRHRSVEVWIALDDTNEENGQLWMVPGSHAWVPTLRGIHGFVSAFHQVSRRIIDRHAVPVPVNAGQAVVFTHAVAHFSLPNKSALPRRVAITDLIPEEAEHLHYFRRTDTGADTYRIDDSFWTDNNPFTLWKPPSESRYMGVTDFAFHELTDEDLDRMVAEGRAVDGIAAPHGAINAAKAWCHRCGATESVEGSPDRWVGNVTLLCSSCQLEEAAHAESAAHAGVSS